MELLRDKKGGSRHRVNPTTGTGPVSDSLQIYNIHTIYTLYTHPFPGQKKRPRSNYGVLLQAQQCKLFRRCRLMLFPKRKLREQKKPITALRRVPFNDTRSTFMQNRPQSFQNKGGTSHRMNTTAETGSGSHSLQM